MNETSDEVRGATARATEYMRGSGDLSDFGGALGVDDGNGVGSRLETLGAAEIADFPAALAFLTSSQRDDGTWQEGPSDRTPDWLMPGSAAARVYLTAHCASVLLRYGGAAERVERGAQALEWSLDPHGRLPGPLAAHWLAAQLFRATDRELAARRLLDVVGRVFDQLGPADLGWFGSAMPPGDRWTSCSAGRPFGDSWPTHRADDAYELRE